MDARGTTSLDWGDGTHLFRLSIPGLVELEKSCDAPIATIFKRVHAGDYSVTDVRETLRLGLIGGGMNPTEALTTIRAQFDDNISEIGLAYHHPYALAVIGGAMLGFVENPLAQPPGPETETAESHPASTSSNSTPKFADLDSSPET